MEQTVLFFDGHCNLCNASVDFVIRRDRRMRIHFAPLQGRTAVERLSLHQREALDTVVLLHKGAVYTESNVALKVAQLLGWPYALLSIGWVIPSFLRNLVYRWVAKNRYRWYGKRETCRLPEPREAKRFLP